MNFAFGVGGTSEGELFSPFLLPYLGGVQCHTRTIAFVASYRSALATNTFL